MQNKDYMQATYNVKYPMDILFDQMETGQEFFNSGEFTIFWIGSW